MIKNLIVLIAMPSCLLAQPTLTVSNFLNVPSVETLWQADLGLLSEGLGGANQFWDFSSETLQNSSSQQILSPTGSAYLADFPGSNVRVNKPTGSGVFAESFYNKSTAKIDFLGYGTISNGNNYVLNLSNPKTILQFPLTYNQSFSDSFSGQAVYNTSGLTLTTFQSGTIDVNVDGYGELYTPFNYLGNTLRLKTRTYQIDSTVVNGFPTSTVSEYISTSYQWISGDLTAGITHYIISYDTSIVNGNVSTEKNVIDYTGFIITEANHDKQSKKEKLSISPIPAHDKVVIRVSEINNYNLELLDISGRILFNNESFVSNKIGDDIYDIDVSNIADGVYFLKLGSSDENILKKIIKN
jgi:hypothetical protein